MFLQQNLPMCVLNVVNREVLWERWMFYFVCYFLKCWGFIVLPNNSFVKVLWSKGSCWTYGDKFSNLLNVSGLFVG